MNLNAEEQVREIKFRAWDEREGEMYTPTDIKLANDKKTWIVDKKIFDDMGFLNEKESKFRNIGEEVILMQFTGLKDKNGKEIYEGDVLESRPTPDVRFVVGFGQNEEDNCYGFCLTSINNGSTYGFDLSVKKMEVIGNIYENPKLLEKK